MRQHALWFRRATVVACLVALPGTAAGRSPRLTTVFQEYVDGRAVPVSSAELALVGALRAAGVRFVDEVQSRKIRSVTDAGQLLGGTVAPVITSLDADVILAGVCRARRLQSDLLGAHAHRYDATLQVKAIAVDTGGVLGAFTAVGKGLAFTPEEAVRKAAAGAAESITARILDQVVRAAGGGPVELTLEGCPNVMACERVLQGVRGLEGVSEVEVLQAGRGLTKVAVVAGEAGARGLALAIDGAPGLGLSVFGYSDRTIKATYDPTRALRLALLVGELTPERKRARRTAGRTYAELMGTALSNVGFLELPGGGRARTLPDERGRWPRLLAKAGVPAARTLLLLGRHRTKGRRVHLEARLVAAASGKAVVAAQRSCPRQEAEACAAALGEELAGDLPGAVFAKRDAFRGLPGLDGLAGAGAAPAKPLEVAAVEVANVFPARLQAYAAAPLGHVRLRNGGEEAIERLRVRATLRDLSQAPVDEGVARLEPGAEVRVPIRLVLDGTRLAELEENRPSVLGLELTYSVGDYQVRQTRAHPVVAYDRNAVSWAEPDSVAAFVTARAAGVAARAQAWAATVPEALSDEPLAVPAALLAGMGASGLRYGRDPVNPFSAQGLDQVLFPLQTLAAGGGDCDDLSVLLAGLAEAVGRRALVLVAPDHVFVALHAGVPVQGARRLALETDRLLEHGGELWLPLEATMVGRPLSEAWARGAKLLTQWRGRDLRVVELRAAWTTFGPVDLVRPEVPPGPDAARVRKAVERDVGAWRKAYGRQVEARLARLARRKGGDAAARHNERGVLLSLLGRRAQARAAFEASIGSKGGSAEAHNNLGNLLFAEGDHSAARAAYRAALESRPDNARIQLNAALAALASGDDDAFAEHVFTCLELGEDGLVEALARAGVQPGGARGAAGGGLTTARLRELVGRAYERAGREPPGPGAGRKASEGGGGLELGRYLFWL